MTAARFGVVDLDDLSTLLSDLSSLAELDGPHGEPPSGRPHVREQLASIVSKATGIDPEWVGVPLSKLRAIARWVDVEWPVPGDGWKGGMTLGILDEAAAEAWAAIVELIGVTPPSPSEDVVDLVLGESYGGTTTPEQRRFVEGVLAEAYATIEAGPNPALLDDPSVDDDVAGARRRGYDEGLGDVGIIYDDDPESPRSRAYDEGRTCRRILAGLEEGTLDQSVASLLGVRPQPERPDDEPF